MVHRRAVPYCTRTAGALAVLLVQACLATTTNTVQTQYGPVAGTVSTVTVTKLPSSTTTGTVVEYLGIPFAQPPLGPLRWTPPQPPTPWTDVLQATSFSARCLQPDTSQKLPPWVPLGSEDCLYLNVYTPVNKTGLPVMLWIPGGWFTEGEASSPVYTAQNMVVRNPNIIIVTIQYRLGVMGFLGSDKLRSSDPNNSTGNYGLQDQRFAMQWVQKNIAAFGGDPTKVTLWGESAGAQSIAMHLVDPFTRGKGLFRAAIMDSGTFTPYIAQPMDLKEKQFQYMLSQAKCSSITCLRGSDAVALEIALINFMLGQPSRYLNSFRPAVDGVELPADPQLLAQEGKIEDVPVLLGTNFNEGTYLMPTISPIDWTTKDTAQAASVQYLLGVYYNGTVTPTETTQVNTLYPLASFDASKDPSLKYLYPTAVPSNTSVTISATWWETTTFMGDAIMVCPVRRTARWFTNRPTSKSYLYSFQIELFDVYAAESYYGVLHASELPFVFRDTLLSGLVPPGMGGLLGPEADAADQMADIWMSFATNLVPNGIVVYDNVSDTLTAMQSSLLTPAKTNLVYTGAAPAPSGTMQLNQVSGWTKAKCDFWDEYVYMAPSPAGFSCGDGIINANEQCDGSALNGATCDTVFPGVFNGGSLSCIPQGTDFQCQFNTTLCVLNLIINGTNGSTPLSGLETTGNDATFPLTLPFAPTAPVLITIQLDGFIGEVNPDLVVFTPANWTNVVLITILFFDNAHQKLVTEGTGSVVLRFTSTDPHYNGRTIVLSINRLNIAPGGQVNSGPRTPVFGLFSLNIESIDTADTIDARGAPLIPNEANEFHDSTAAGIVYAALGSTFGVVLIAAVLGYLLCQRTSARAKAAAVPATHYGLP